jgi:hypothetical protein
MFLAAKAVLLLLLVVLLLQIVLRNLYHILMLLLDMVQLLQRVSRSTVPLQWLQLYRTCAPAVYCCCSHLYGYGSTELSCASIPLL